MIRSARRYDVEVRMRDCFGGTVFGSVNRFLYEDEEGRDWAKINGDWAEIEGGRYDDTHVFVDELPRDLEEAA